MAADERRRLDRGRRFVASLRGSLRFRITSGAVAVVGLALVIGAIALVSSLHAVLTREARVTATVRASELADIVSSGRDPSDAVAGDDVVVQVFDADGQLLTSSLREPAGPVLPVLAPGESRVVSVPFDDGYFVAVAARADSGRTVMLAQSLDPVADSTSALAILLAIGLPILLLLVGVTTWRVVGRALVPVDAIRAEVDAISAEHLHRRVTQPVASDEIARLAATMNRMLDRLERARNRERQFVADASHELRTPIATVRQRAEIALAHPELSADLATVAHAESVRMQALVEDLLLLAQADADVLSLRRRPVDLDDVVLAEATRLRTDGHLAIDTRCVSAVRVDGDAAALRRVLHNLGDNAARHARSRVALGVSEVDGWAEVRVDDDGSGIPSADRTRVFERFVRLDGARARSDGGSGLGLAIVAEIVAAHGGTVIIADGPLGGARVIVRLPLAS